MGRSAGDCGSFSLPGKKKAGGRMAQIRLDKYLADAGFGTRKEVKLLIKKRQVTVNDTIILQSDCKVDMEKDVICVEGKCTGYESFSYYMLHKPQGVVSATKDEKEKTVISLIQEPKRRDLFPVGRLDKDTEGLLLITNDGKLANELLRPGKHVEKTYYARINGCVTNQEVLTFAEGLDIGDAKKTMPAKLEIVSSGEESEILVTIMEGRYHQVKRMFQAVGMKVLYLKRLTMGPLKLDEALEKGEYRKLTEEEIDLLMAEKGAQDV